MSASTTVVPPTPPLFDEAQLASPASGPNRLASWAEGSD
jgi:hypothetical protein